MKNALLLAVGLLVVSQGYAATYYFSTSGNNTTGDGSQVNPFYSLCGPWSGSGATTGNSKISSGQITINPGDTLLFKRGDEWVGFDAQWTINCTGAPGNPVTFGAYGDSNLPRPLFTGAKTAHALGKDTWTNVAGTPIWYTSGIDWYPHMAAQESTAVDGPHLNGAFSVTGQDNSTAYTGNQSMVRGTWYYDGGLDRLYVWRTDNLKPDHAQGRDIYIGVSPSDGTERMIKVNRGYNGPAGAFYVFQDLHVRMSAGYGFSTSYADTQYINCLAEMCGMEGFLFDKRRFGAPSPGAKNGLMQNCVARRNNLRAGTGIGQGVTFEAENCWAVDSESYENAWAGFDFLDYDANTNTNGGGLINCKAYNNGISPVAQGCYDPNVYVDGGSHITIQDCELWGAGVSPRGNKTRTYANPGISLDIEGNAFLAGKRPTNLKVINTVSRGNMGEAIRIGVINGHDGWGDKNPSRIRTMSNIQIINCTLQRDKGDSDIKGYYDINGVDSGIRVIKLGEAIIGGFVFKNNIVLGLNTARAPLFDGPRFVLQGKSVVDFDNNIFYCPGVNFNTTGSFNSGGFYSYGYISNDTLDAWRNESGPANMQQNTAFSKTLMTSNPLLVSASGTNFNARLQAGSPAIDRSNTSLYAALPFEMEGTTRVDDALDVPYNDLGFHYTILTSEPPTPDTIAPSAPANLAASVSGTQINLSWNASTDNVGVTAYEVFRGGASIGITAGTSFTMSNATQGTTYSFTVKAFDAADNISAASNTATVTVPVPPDTTAPSAPTNLVASVSGTTISLTWSASTDNVAVTGYQISRGGTVIGTSTTTGFSVSNAAIGTHSFTVKAHDAANNYSAASNTVSATVADTTAPSAPTNLAGNLIGNTINLTWTASTDNVGVTGYQIFNSGTLIGNSTGTNFAVANANQGTTYSFTVKAQDAASNTSAASNIESVTVPDTTAPTAPANLAATASANQISLTWTASSDNVGVTGYNIYNGSILIGSSTGTSYTVANAAPGAYALTVKAKDAANNISASSNSVSVTVADSAAPSAPANLAGVVSGNQVTLTWTASSDNVGVTGYQIFRGATAIGNSTGTSFVATNLAAGIHSFTVKAHDAAGNYSAASNAASATVADTVAPSAPASLTGVRSGTTINLTWSAATDNVGVTGYQVSRAGTVIGNPTTTSFAYTNAVVGTHSFTVKARDAAANYSAASNTATVTVPDTTAPSVPANLAATISGNTINLTWSAAIDNVGVAGYQILRGGTAIGTSTGTSFATTGTPGTAYSFTVKARDAANNYSAASTAVSATVPDTTAPTTPANLTATVSGTSITLAWGASTDNGTLKGYRIYRGTTVVTSIYTLTPRTYTISNLTPGTYSYTVKAFDSVNNFSAASNTATATIASSTPPPPPLVIYSDSLQNGFQDWHWGAQPNFANTTPVHSGTRSIRNAFNAWDGLQLGRSTTISTAGYTHLTMAVWPGQTGQKLILWDLVNQTTSVDLNTYAAGGQLVAGRWNIVTIPLTALRSNGTVSVIKIMENQQISSPITTYFDTIQFVKQ